MNEQITRRKFIILLGTAAAIDLTAAACVSAGTPEHPLPSPVPLSGLRAEQTAAPIESWRKLPSTERINALELKQYPSIPDFDLRHELVLAAAELCYQNGLQKKTPEEIQIKFVNANEFLEAFGQEFQETGSLTPEEKAAILTGQIEMVSKKSKIAYIYEDGLQRTLEEMKKNRPDLQQSFGAYDLDTVFLKTLILHIISHINQTEKPYSFTPPIGGVDQIDGLDIKGKNEQGIPFRIAGAREAATAYAGFIIGQQTQSGTLNDEGSSRGILLIHSLNKKAGVDPERFLKYYTGKLSLPGLFQEWGALKKSSQGQNQTAAIYAFAIIGLFVEHKLSKEQAEQEIILALSPIK